MAPENKLGITSSPELAEAEEYISKRNLDLFDNGVLDSLKRATQPSKQKIYNTNYHI